MLLAPRGCTDVFLRLVLQQSVDSEDSTKSLLAASKSEMKSGDVEVLIMGNQSTYNRVPQIETIRASRNISMSPEAIVNVPSLASLCAVSSQCQHQTTSRLSFD